MQSGSDAAAPDCGSRMKWARALRRVLPRTFRKVDPESLEELEERLIMADFGVDASLGFVEAVERAAGRGEDPASALAAAIRAVFDGDGNTPLAVAPAPPTVYLFVGVNGTGKTTTIGKLAHRLAGEGRSVMVAAADTYRAGATEQLARWADRAGADFVRGQPGGDPAAVAFDALEPPAPAPRMCCSSTPPGACIPTRDSCSSSPRWTA